MNGQQFDATIMSLPTELVIMIIEKLPLKDALELCKALQLKEQVAMQYSAFVFESYRYDYYLKFEYYGFVEPSSFKCLLKNKLFLAKAPSYVKTLAAFKTFDLDLVKKYLEEVKPDLNEAFVEAASSGFTDAVKLLLSDSRIDPSHDRNFAILWAARYGHLEIVKLLLSVPRVDPSDQNNFAIRWAAYNGHLEIVEVLLLDPRVNPSDIENQAIRWAANKGHLELVKLLLLDPRVVPSDGNNEAIRYAAREGHWEIIRVLLSDPRVDPSDRNNDVIRCAARKGHWEIVKVLLSDPRVNSKISRRQLNKLWKSCKKGSVKTQDMHIHGMNPQHLIETILRGRIYECVYWKTHCFALNAETLVDKAVELKAVGGHYSNQKPTDFICLVLKLLEIAPEPAIIQLFLNTFEFKYLIALGAFYLRLTGTSKEIYKSLEPLLNDKRKLRFRQHDGKHVIIFMDVFIDDLLRKDRVFDTILPRLTKRHVLEELGDLEPRVSSLEQELLQEESDHSSSESSEEEPVIKEKPTTTSGSKKEWSKKKVKSLFKQSKNNVTPVTPAVVLESKKDSESLSIEETNRIRASLGLKPLKQ